MQRRNGGSKHVVQDQRFGGSGAGEGATLPRRLGGFSAAYPAPPVLGRSTCRSGGSAVACGQTEGAWPTQSLLVARLLGMSECPKWWS
eukprot:5898483-Prymnesium_polylepis.1